MTLPGGKSRARAETLFPGAGAVPVLAAHDGLFLSTGSFIRNLVRAETGAGRLLPWVAVSFGAGITLYFGTDREPVAFFAVGIALVLALLAFLFRRSAAFVPLALIAAMGAGLAVPALKASRIQHSIFDRSSAFVSLKGHVETREIRERTDRIILRVSEAKTGAKAVDLTRVRLSVRKGTAPDVGSYVSLRARLQPPMQPARPGGYDFARDMYFASIAASGFVMGPVTPEAVSASPGLYIRYAAVLQGMRDAIDARIGTILSGDTRIIATALLTGRRDAISRDVNDAMFISGLGHVLSISGYHMAVVAGVVFFAIRAMLALNAHLVVASPIKKWAALAALCAATFYLLLSGSEVATQRSYVMTSVVLAAVMLDRRAITFRTLAIAMMLVLLISPEALVHPSFQMSFAATLGLVALVQVGMPHLLASTEHGTTARIALWGGRELAMLTLASLVAGLATMPFAAYHFHRITPYGVLANLAAMPVVSIIVMPAGMLALLFMPLGLDGVFWRLMGLGIDWMVATASWVSELPGAIVRISAFDVAPLLLMTGGLIVLCLLRTWLRAFGLALAAAGIALAITAPRPDILIASDGTGIAVRNQTGRLQIVQTVKNEFVLRQWLAADGDERTPDQAIRRTDHHCDVEGCVLTAADGRIIALAKKMAALDDDCNRADVVITRFNAPADCKAILFDRDRLKASGAIALTATRAGFEMMPTHRASSSRPWTPMRESTLSASSRSVASASSKVRPIDATPSQDDLRADGEVAAD